MTVYFFHLRDDRDLLIDAEGRDLADIAAIADEALREARALISAEVLEGRLDLSQRFEIVDAAHALVHQLVFADAIEIVHPEA